jgi:hypothetical protein
MFLLERDLRMAACDPMGSANARIISFNANTLEFTMDITGGDRDHVDNDGDGLTDDDDPAEKMDEAQYYDGKVDEREHIRYTIVRDASGYAYIERREIDDSGVKEDNIQIVAEYIDALDFVYLDENENTTASVDDIRSVQVTLVGRSPRPDNQYINKNTYTNQQGTVIFSGNNDEYRRWTITSNIVFRNLEI